MIVAYHTDGSAHWSSGDIALMDKPPFDDNPVAMAVDSALNLYFTTARFDLDRENCWFYTSKLKNGGVVASGWPQEWKAYSQGNDNIPKAMAVDSSGNVYVTGTYYPPSKLYSYFVTLKYQPNGAMAAGWPQTGDDELYDYFDEGAALALDSHGNVIFVGTVDDLNHKKKICTIKYGPGGNTIWRQYHYNGLDVYGRAVVVDKKDNVYVAGYAAGLTTLLKYQADGKLAWHTTLNSCNPVGLGMGDKQAATGHVYVAGTFQIPVGLPHYFGARFSQVVTLPYDLLLLY
jgi:hypothetical protein